MSLDSDWYVSLNGWRTAAQVSLRDICTDHSCLEPCGCILGMSITDSIPVVVESTSDVVTESCNWVCNLLCNPTFVNREEVLSASGWLSEAVIESAQLLILQQFPHMAPILQQAQAFQVHRGEFVQIIHVRDSHWCTVSNVGCNDGVVNVYDTLYPSVSNVGCNDGIVNVYDTLYPVSADTIRLIASLVFSSASQLVIQMMDVGRQSNGSDCGVLAIAFAYDICAGDDPCKAKYDHKLIRLHLANCLESCTLSHFPLLGERRTRSIKHIQVVDLHCSCPLPEEAGDDMAECDACKAWYHRYC